MGLFLTDKNLCTFEIQVMPCYLPLDDSIIYSFLISSIVTEISAIEEKNHEWASPLSGLFMYDIEFTHLQTMPSLWVRNIQSHDFISQTPL